MHTHTHTSARAQGDEACIGEFEKLAQDWDKENASKFVYNAQPLSSRDLDCEVRDCAYTHTHTRARARSLSLSLSHSLSHSLNPG